MKRVILAIDSFKGCLTSSEVEMAVEEAIKQQYTQTEIKKVPVTDGGDGMLDVYCTLLCCKQIPMMCHDALMRPIRASYAVTKNNLVIIETAQSCGINLIAYPDLNPLRATTYGVGELLLDAVKKGYRQFIIGLGGSATSDCGLGMLSVFKDFYGSDWLHKIPDDLDITLASDVNNPLCGINGAANVFGPQKGATQYMIECLERRAQTFSRMAAQKLGFDKSTVSGAGAAGGLGYAFLQFFHARMESGADLLLNKANFEDLIATSDLIITGEGSADRQTLMGKLPSKILSKAKEIQIPVALIAGKVSDVETLLKAGFASVRSINPPGISLDEALKPEVARENIFKLFASGLV